MSKGEYSTLERRRSEVHNSFDVPAYEGVEMPTREECRSQAEADFPSDLSDVFQRGNFRRTIHERTEFENRVRKKSVTQKDIEAIYDGIAKDKDDRNVLGEVDPIDVEVTGIYCVNLIFQTLACAKMGSEKI